MTRTTISGGRHWWMLALATMLALASCITACGSGGQPSDGPGDPIDTGTLGARLEVPGYLEAATVRFELTNEDGETRTEDVELTTGDFSKGAPQVGQNAFADWLTVVPAGKYTVKAYLVDADGNVIAQCPAASGEVEVVAGETAELTLTTQCSGSDTGGLDVSFVVKGSPKLTGLDTESSKFVCLGEGFDVELTAEDPENDPLSWSFSVTEVPKGVDESAYCLMNDGPRAAFSALAPGRYTLKVEVSDGNSTTALTFPVYIGECGQARCPGLAAADSLGDPAQNNTKPVVQGTCDCEVPTLAFEPNNPPAYATVANVTPGKHIRTVSRYVTDDGRAVDFVDNEMLVMTDDPDELSGLLSRWSGEVRGTIDFAAFGIEQPPVYRVGVDPSSADLADFPRKWAIAIGAEGTHSFSSEQGARLFAAALSELQGGVSVAINPILTSADFPGRSTLEEPAPDVGIYNTRDAYAWPYMNRASAQDIGTGEAWTVLDAAGLLGNRVRIGIADGGFIVNDDFPAGTVVAGPEHVENPASCTGGSECQWHGTWVSLTAAAVPDNEIGVAGPAGPIADLTALPSPAPDFYAYIEYIFANIPTSLAARPQIINISAGVSLPREACLALLGGVPLCETLHGLTSAFRLGGSLIFAAAGNTNEDVDALKDYTFFTDEADILLPCELDGVICVGGLDWDSNAKAPDSSYGTLPADGHSVDIFGPFDQFVIADPEAADDGLTSPDTSVARESGTSFSSPYVAGVAALIWAANPGLDDDQVEQILFDTSHTTSNDPNVPRWVNALGGTLRSLGRDAPPFLRIVTAPMSIPRGTSLRLAAVVEEIDGQSFTVEWLRDGAVFATGLHPVVSTDSWAVGRTVIQARATDSTGNVSAVDSVDIDVTDTAPAEARTVTGPDTGTLCPIGPEHGDADFNGGPTIEVDVALRISADGSQLLADIDFSATAPASDSDGSFVTERFTHVMYTAADTERIVTIESDDTFQTTFVGQAGGAEIDWVCNDGTPETHTYSTIVDELVVIADTGSSDISNDSNCHCDTQIRNITFQPVDILVAPR